jgi:hypothetical protein
MINTYLLWKSKGLIPCSRGPATGTYPELSEYSPIGLRSILIISPHLRLYLPTDLFPSRFRTKILHTFYLSKACCVFRPFMLLDVITLIIFGEEHNLWSSSLCSFLQYPVTSSLTSLNALKNPQSMFIPWELRDQVSHPHQTTQGRNHD